MIRMLVITTLFPNSVQPRHGIFVSTRLRQLVDSGEVTAEVIAPVPWFPLKHDRFGVYGKYARVPNVEQLDDITVHHPRYLVVPKIGMLLTPFTLAFAIWRAIRKLRCEAEQFDLIDAHYFYPDGVSAAIVSKITGIPCFITARGSDINVIGSMRLPGRMIRWASRQAKACIAVCQALKNRMVELGISKDSITVLRNGVDTRLFRVNPDAVSLHDDRPRSILSVGNLIKLKGHDLVIEALVQLPDVRLTIVGDGPERSHLHELAVTMGVSDRVQFVGNISQSELVIIYQSADALVLASSSEGMANVILESIACGTPVVATDVGGAKEVLVQDDFGRLLTDRSPSAIAEGVRSVMKLPLDSHANQLFVELFSWDKTTKGLLKLFEQRA